MSSKILSFCQLFSQRKKNSQPLVNVNKYSKGILARILHILRQLFTMNNIHMTQFPNRRRRRIWTERIRASEVEMEKNKGHMKGMALERRELQDFFIIMTVTRVNNRYNASVTPFRISSTRFIHKTTGNFWERIAEFSRRSLNGLEQNAGNCRERPNPHGRYVFPLNSNGLDRTVINTHCSVVLNSHAT